MNYAINDLDLTLSSFIEIRIPSIFILLYFCTHFVYCYTYKYGNQITVCQSDKIRFLYKMIIFLDERKCRETIKCSFSYLTEHANSGSGDKVITNSSRKRYNRKYSDPRKQPLFINCKIKSVAENPAIFHINVTPGKRREERKSIVIETNMRSSLILGIAILTIAATSIVQAHPSKTRSEHTCGSLGPGMCEIHSAYKLLILILF